MSFKRLKSMSKFLIVIQLVLLTLLVGCSGGEKTQSEEAKDGEVVIKAWVASDSFRGEDSSGMRTVKEFNEANKGKIRVEVKYAPWEEHNPSMQAAFASGDVPDIFQLFQGSQISDFAEDELIRPLTGLVSEDWKNKYYEGSFKEGVNTIDGKIYTWPITGPQMIYMLYYNKDVLKNAGLDPEKPPKTWDELRDMAKVVSEQGKGDIYGLTFPGGGPAVFVQNTVAGFAQGINAEHTSSGFNYKTGQYEINSENWIDSVNFLLDLKKDGSILPSTMMLKVPEAQMLFAEGKSAFLIDGRWSLRGIKDEKPDVNLGVTHLPTPDGSTPTYGYNLAVPNNGFVISSETKHPEIVGKVIEEVFSSEAYYERYIEDAEALVPIPEINEKKDLYPFPEYEEFVKTHKETLKEVPSPFVRNNEQTSVSNEIGGMEQSKMKPNIGEIMVMLMNGTEKPEEKLTETNDLLNNNLKKAVEKVKGDGGNVSLEDYVFPNWDPKVEYTEEDYKAIK